MALKTEDLIYRMVLKKLLSPKKFIPIYNARIKQEREKLGVFSVELHWTSVCNYSCRHCSYGDRRQCGEKLSDSIIEEIINELHLLGTKSVYLSGGGEPTTIKNWSKNAQNLINKGIEVALITNGVNIKDEDIQTLARFNYIAVSVYSTDEPEYREITGGSYFDRQFLFPSRLKSFNTGAIAGARCVINNTNFKNTLNIYRKAMESGFDYIIFIPAVDYENKGLGLDSENAVWLTKFLDENKDFFDFEKTNIDLLLTKKINHYQPKDYRDDLEEKLYCCFAVELRTNAFINYDGGVYLCQPHIGNPKYSIGNVNNDNFSQIWNSTRHKEVIELLNEDFSEGKCKNCRSISFNIEAIKKNDRISEILDPFI